MGLAAKDAAAPQIPIIEHADVRRMLLAQKSYVEGGLALELYCARLVDELHTGDAATAQARPCLTCSSPSRRAGPASGAWRPTAGDPGAGRVWLHADFPVEQYWRDNRLNMIHEGTHGIQALDLLGRKVVQQGGPQAAGRRVQATLERAMQPTGPRSPSSWSRRWRCWAAPPSRPGARTSRTEALANAVPYLQAFGHTVVAWLWLDVALASTGNGAGAQGRQAAARYFFAYELPKTAAWLDVVARRESVCRDMRPDWF